MTRFVPIASFALAATAVGISAWPRAESTPVAPVAVDASRDEHDAELEALRRRVEAIDDDQRALWSRLLMLEQRASGVAPSMDGGSLGAAPPELSAQVAQLKQEVRAVMQGEVLSDAAGRSAMKELVREVEADAARERQVQWQARQQQRAAEQQAKWKSFISNAKLTYQQEQTITQRLAAEDASRKALFESGAPPGRESMRSLREQRRETDSLVMPMLDETQRQQYQELRREEQGGGRGGDGRSRGDGETPRRQRSAE